MVLFSAILLHAQSYTCCHIKSMFVQREGKGFSEKGTAIVL